MGDGTTTEISQRPITRMWAVLQRLGQQRDQYSRDRTADGRRERARRLVGLADDLRELAAEVLREAEAGGGEPG